MGYHLLSAMCRPFTLLAAVVLTAGAPRSHAQANAAEMSESARTYLTGVLDTMEKSALNRDSIDWKRVRAESFALAGNAQATTDTYVAIAHAIGELKERHSFLMHASAAMAASVRSSSPGTRTWSAWSARNGASIPSPA